MLISRKHNFLFVHIYKNAGTSITHALRPFALPQWQWTARRLLTRMKLPWPFFEPHPFPPHVTAPEMLAALGPDTFHSYFSFAIVRNPWDWQVSLYKYMLKSDVHHQHDLVTNLTNFEEYIEWRCANEVRYQKDYLCAEGNELLVDFVGRYEHLDADFEQICSRIGIRASLPKLNVSNTKPYQDYYTQRTRDLVQQAFKPDIELFDYRF